MFHFLPLAIRYDGSAGAAGHGYQVHVGPMYSDARGSVTLKTTDPHDHPALRFNYLSTEQDRREWVEAIRVARHILNQPAMDAVQRRRDVAWAGGDHRRRDPRLGRARRRDRAASRRAPRGWARTSASVVDPLTMRVHGLDGLRVVDASVDAVRHQRQHLRAGDDGRREGRRPDPRQHAAAAPRRRSTGTARVPRRPAPSRASPRYQRDR